MQFSTPAQPHVEEYVGVSAGGNNCLNAPMTESKSQYVTAEEKSVFEL